MRSALKIFVGLCGFWAVGFAVLTPAYGFSPIERKLYQTLDRRGAALKIGGERIDAPKLKQVYVARGYKPIWFDRKTRLTEKGAAVVLALGSAADQGLNPDHYRVAEIALLLQGPSVASAAAADLLITHELMHFATDVGNGRLEPGKVDEGLLIYPRREVGVEVIAGAIATADIEEFLSHLTPHSSAYGGLREALQRYRAIAVAGGWAPIGGGASIREGDMDARVNQIRARLVATGDLQSTVLQSRLFDAELSEAVRRYQARNGLPADGAVGPATLAVMNVPVVARIQQIEINMERLRWRSEHPHGRHVIVNIAAYDLFAYEGGEQKLRMRVVVGLPYRKTPVFSSQVKRIELNPYWNVPPSIARLDLVPKIIADADYLQRQGFKVFSDWSAEAVELDPLAVDWQEMNGEVFPLKLRQEPGQRNALGRYKFRFPNEHNIYLHDTASPQLFAQEVRAFSSGCVRVEDPDALALFLLAGHPQWTPEALEAALASGKNMTVELDQFADIHMTYLTAWGEAEGHIQFRADIYGRDAALIAALKAEEGR